MHLSALHTPASIPVNISAIISIYRRFDTIYRFTNKFRHNETEEYPRVTLHKQKRRPFHNMILSPLGRQCEKDHVYT
ncbi:hypothetical protein, partial [Bacillus paranthracis]|uniref:hypothetical protein n=1 Tax=Bacillus paranthracis TaxID=2026186 RepID=UPI002FD83142